MADRLPRQTFLNLQETFFWMGPTTDDSSRRLPASMYRDRSFDDSGDSDVVTRRFVAVVDDDEW